MNISDSTNIIHNNNNHDIRSGNTFSKIKINTKKKEIKSQYVLKIPKTTKKDNMTKLLEYVEVPYEFKNKLK